MIQASDLVDALAAVSATVTDEYDLQCAIAAALTDAGHTVAREIRLTDGVSRVDVFIEGDTSVEGTWWRGPGIAIEVKIAGSTSSVVRQLERYARCAEVGELILVTTRAKHHAVPRVLEGKPVYLVSLVEGGL